MSVQLKPPPTLIEQVGRAGDQRLQRLGPLWELTPAQRINAMREGRLTLEQLAAWSARHPDQVPELNGEFEWIAAKTPEACE